MRLFVFDDARADAWEPFALTRPCGELRFGASLLRERLEAATGLAASAALTRPWLTAFREEGAPPCLPRHRPPAAPQRGVWLSSRFVPAGGLELDAGDEARPLLFVCGGEVAGLRLPAGHEPPDAAWLAAPAPRPDAEMFEVPGRLLPHVWSLVEGNAERLAADLADGPCGAPPPPHVHVLGDGSLQLGRDVRIEPGVVLDVRNGGIRLDEGVEVRAGCRLEGPLHVGSGGRLLGGAMSRLAAGPRSYLRGEIEESIVLGYANKAHDGFLGHALVGRWVNLGAGTTNSDLKNNYGPVRLGAPDGDIDTGLLKLGCLLGDHVRTAIGTLFTTGTVAGAGASVFGPGAPPKWIPPFAWGAGALAGSYRIDRFLETAATAMPRRGVPCDEDTRRWLSAAWDEARRRYAG
ncbi:MAG: putative sugar nucleotidyl transferase [Gemmatimonadota bacterium]|nr:putative sugar nucleotidyl transferase [Gemmatimonadota bacterium]